MYGVRLWFAERWGTSRYFEGLTVIVPKSFFYSKGYFFLISEGSLFLDLNPKKDRENQWIPKIKIYTDKNKWLWLWVCVMCPLMHSTVLQRTEPKLARVVGARCPRGMVNFLKRPNQRSKVIQMSICLRNALWPPNLVGRVPECNTLLGSKVIQGSAGVNQRSNCLEIHYDPLDWLEEALSRV